MSHSLSSLPKPGFTNYNISPLSRYELISQMRGDFCRRWKDEYLNTLHSYACWHEIKGQINVNSVALLKDENTPFNKWPLAQFTEMKVGRDGHLHLMMVRTATGEFKRQLGKLCLLLIATG